MRTKGGQRGHRIFGQRAKVDSDGQQLSRRGKVCFDGGPDRLDLRSRLRRPDHLG